MKILFVDDAPDLRSLYSYAFRLEGHSTVLAANGVEAVEAVRGEAFDAIIMDVGMPRMNGYETARRIRARDWAGSAIIIAVTGWGQEGDRAQSREAG